MLIILDYDILNEEDKIEDLINKIDGHDGHIDLAISSEGGDPFLAAVITNYLNENMEKIRLIASDFVASAAFRIFHGFKGKKAIVEGTCGLVRERTIHGLSITGKINNPNNKQTKFNVERADYFSDAAQRYYAKILTKKELNAFKKGDDIPLSFRRMMEIFPEATIIE